MELKWLEEPTGNGQTKMVWHHTDLVVRYMYSTYICVSLVGYGSCQHTVAMWYIATLGNGRTTKVVAMGIGRSATRC